MLYRYPLSYEGPRCTFAQHDGRLLVRRARAGCLAPDGLCRTCAACREPAEPLRPHTRRRLYGGWCRPRRAGARRSNKVTTVVAAGVVVRYMPHEGPRSFGRRGRDGTCTWRREPSPADM